ELPLLLSSSLRLSLFHLLSFPIFASLQRGHFAQASQMSLLLAEIGVKEGLDQIPSDCWSYGPASHTKNIHVIVLDSLLRREVVVDQRRANASDFVRADRSAHTAAAYCAAGSLSRGAPRLARRQDVVGFFFALPQPMIAKITPLIPRLAEPFNLFFLQTNPAVIGSNSNSHTFT